jgi:hypothetical protein
VFPVRYELDSYILFGRNAVFKGLRLHFPNLTLDVRQLSGRTFN